VRLVQLLANVPKAQNTANGENHPLQGTSERQAEKALIVGMTADEATPADHIRARAPGLAFCIEIFSVCTPKKGRCSKIQRSPGGQPSGFPVPPTIYKEEANAYCATDQPVCNGLREEIIEEKPRQKHPADSDRCRAR